MNHAEALARQIRRVARIEETYRTMQHFRDTAGDANALAVIGAVLERACIAAGTGDVVAIQAIGIELELIK